MLLLRRGLVLTLGLLQFIFVLGAVERSAHAYVDPGSGLLAFQAASSIFAGAVFFLRKRLRRVFQWRGSRIESTADTSTKQV